MPERKRPRPVPQWIGRGPGPKPADRAERQRDGNVALADSARKTR
jgi:hypothetical protein